MVKDDPTYNINNDIFRVILIVTNLIIYICLVPFFVSGSYKLL